MRRISTWHCPRLWTVAVHCCLVLFAACFLSSVRQAEGACANCAAGKYKTVSSRLSPTILPCARTYRLNAECTRRAVLAAGAGARNPYA
eukprot:3213063-Rhodomonas_salina.3